MSDYRRTFDRANTFLPVIHVDSKEQALRNASIAQENGADGVFLINHEIPALQLLRAYIHVTDQLPDLWVGLNCLDKGRSAITMLPNRAAGFWVDDAGIEEDGPNRLVALKRFNDFRQGLGWQGIYFGGVAFKSRAPVRDPAAAAKAAAPFVDVITTSGEGTGIAPDLGKIKAMKLAIGTHPLAIASGITPENVRSFMPYADCFLVATGISHSHTELDPPRVRELARIIRD